MKNNSLKENKKSPVAAFCNALGIFLLVAVVATCLPLTVPKAFGYHIYTVISGSMEPKIPIGSLVYIKDFVPEDIVEEDVIAYYGAMDEASIITHRVVENRMLMGEFVTKGDANKTKDMNPVPYDNFIGKVTLSIPKIGNAAQLLTSSPGKIAAVCTIIISIVLQMAASAIGKKK